MIQRLSDHILKMQQLDDVTQQLNQAKSLLKTSEQALIARQSAISQTESRILELEQAGQSVATEYQSELAENSLALVANDMRRHPTSLNSTPHPKTLISMLWLSITVS